MAVWMNELRRKAQAGIALVDATPEKQKIYDEWRKKFTDEAKTKAQAGVALTNPNTANQKIWDDKRKEIDAEIEKKALAGTALTNPNAYNQSMYDKFVADNKNKTITNTNTEDNQIGDVGKSDDTQTNTATTTQTSTQTPQNYIEGLTQAKRDAQVASLAKSRDQALSNLQAEREGIAPKYYDARNQVAAGAQQQARNFAEFMAARGGTRSGANAQATLMNNMSLQGNLGSLGRQEAQAFGDIGRRETDVRNQYLNNLNEAEAKILGDRMNLLLNDYYRAQDRGDRLTQQAIQNEFARAGLTGFLGGQRTLAGQGFDRNVFESDRGFDYQQSRDIIGDQRYDERFEYDKSRDKLLDDRYDERFDYDKSQDKITNDNWNKKFLADVTGTYVDANGVVRQTTAEEQRKLQELWLVADQTGVIGAQLGEIYGLPANTQTMAGKQFALNQKQTESSIENNNASKTQSGINTLLNIWEMSGIAPKGLEKYGIPAGTPYNKQTSSSVSSSSGSSSGSTATPKVSAKDSLDNYFDMIDGFEVEGATRERALKYIEDNRDYLTDSDYRKLREWIIKNLK